jgi:TRAP-type C4-dicarboxylate transport system permease small subunit
MERRSNVNNTELPDIDPQIHRESLAPKKGRVRKFLDGLFNGLANLDSIIFLALLAVVLIGLVLRYFLKIPNPYGDILARNLMVFSLLLGFSIACNKRSHLGVEVVWHLIPPAASYILQYISKIVTIFMFGVVALSSFSLTIQTYLGGAWLSGTTLPRWIMYAVMAIGFVFCVVAEIYLFWKLFVVKIDVDDDEEDLPLA